MNVSQLVPNRFLFRFEFPLYRCGRAPRIDGRAEDWDSRFLLPPLHELDEEKAIGLVYASWNEAGLYVACRVDGKKQPPQCEPARFWRSDGLRLMTDMRDTRTIHRATRFCRQFYFMPAGGGPERDDPAAGAAAIHRATEEAPAVPVGTLAIAARVHDTGYSLTAHLHARALHGFDPAEHRRIGFFYILEDGELGQQSLTVGDDLNWWVDPSTWPTAVLVEG